MISAAAVSGFMQHRAGDLIKGRYQVLEHLGGGNFGSVYRVLDSVVGNFLACKEMHVLDDPNTAADERALALDLFKREALNLATLRHPHIPAAYFEQEDGAWNICPLCGFDFPGDVCPDHNAPLLKVSQRHYLMMDFIDGPTLEDIAVAQMREQGRPLEEAQCLEWMAQIGSALRSLHRVNIVHRDVKPDNIKIRHADNMAMLLDFGLTKKVEEAGGYGTVRISGTGRFGTSGYAPDSPRELDRPGRQSDVHALGMTLYRLLAGRDPQEITDLMEMRAHAPRYFNAAITPEVERIIRRAIEPDIARRYASIDELLSDLQEIQAPHAKSMAAPPFTFANGLRARTAGDLARLVETYPGEAQNYLFNGMFGHWLLQNGFAAPARAAEDVLEKHKQDPPRALEMFRRALYPAGTTNVLPRLEVEPAALDFGALDSGARATRKLHIRNVGPGLAWGRLTRESDTFGGANDGGDTTLPGLRCPQDFEGNDVSIEVTLDTSRVAAGSYNGALLIGSDAEAVRVPVHYTVNALQLSVEPPELDFGTVLVGKRAIRTLRVRPAREGGTGKARGTIYNSASLGGLVAPERFEGEAPIEIILDGGMPDAVAKAYEGVLQLDTNGGRLRVPVRYRITLPPGRLVTLIVGAMLAGGLGAALARYAYAVVNGFYATRWLVSGGAIVPLMLDNFQQPISLGALAGLGYGLFWTARNWRRRDLTAHTLQITGQPLALCTILGAALFWMLIWPLHWIFWGFGDWLLLPLARAAGEPLSRQAPLGWAGAGALIGLVWGIGRVFVAVGKPWARLAVGVGLGLAFLIVLVNAMVATGG